MRQESTGSEYTCLSFGRHLKVGFARFFLCLFLSTEINYVEVVMSEIVKEKVSAYAEELLPSLGLELVEVQFRREQHGWVLRIFIDAEEGVNLDDCSRVSRELGDYLDVEDIIDHAYNLEVSSPGLERKLSKTEDFARFVGSKAKIKFQQPYEGQKTYVGEIIQVDGENILLLSEEGKELRFTFATLSTARLSL